MKKTLLPACLALAGIYCGSFTPAANAATLTWSGANTSGSWSVATNWAPTTATAPTTSDTATLADATADRIIYYDASASGTLNTLNITETSGFLNKLTLYRNLGVASAVTLGAASGTSAIMLDTSLGSNGSTGANLSFTAPSITINSGGLLGFVVSGAGNGYSPSINSSVILNSGGQLVMYRSYSNANSGQATLNGSLVMTGGTLTFAAPFGSYANVTNNRLLIYGTANISGGTIYNYGGGNLRFENNGAIIINDVTFSGTAPAITLESSGSQSFVSNVTWSTGDLAALGINPGNTGNAIKYVGSSVAGGTLTVGWIQMGERTAGGTTTLQLTSDITSLGSKQLNAQNGAGVNTVVTLGLDTNGHTLDLSANTGATSPWVLTGSISSKSNVIWLLTNSAGAGSTGKIKAQGFDFSATSGSGVTVGANVTLESVGAAVGNNLNAVAGYIDPTSTFLYSGSATAASPAALSSTRNIGNLTVTNGVLKITNSNLVTGGTVTVTNGGTLDLGSYSVTAGKGFILGSGTASGYVKGSNALILASTSGDAVNATLISGTVASVISSGTALSNVVKTNDATTVVLTGNNTYLGETDVTAGVLSFNTVAAGGAAQALGAGNAVKLGVAATSSGTLQYTGAAGTLDKNISALGNGSNTVKNAGSGELNLSGSISNNGTNLVFDGGAAGLNVSGIVNGSGANSNLFFNGKTTLSGTANGSNLTVTGGTTSNVGQANLTGTVTVVSGARFANNGPVSAANINVGGLLTGTGAITGALTIQSGGELAPGGSASVVGSLTVQTGAKVSLQVATLSSFDQLSVSNGVTLGGALTLSLSDAFLAETAGLTALESIKLIDNAGSAPLTSTFESVSYITTSGTYAVTDNTFTIGTTVYDLSYSGGDGNDVVLTVVPEPGTWAMIAGGLGMLLMSRRTLRRKA